MAPRAFWLGLFGSIAVGALGAGAQNAFPEGSWEKGLAQLGTFIGIVGFFYTLWLWESATPRLIEAHESEAESGGLTRWLVPHGLRQAWVRAAIDARDRGMRGWESRNADRITALRLAGHRPETIATFEWGSESARWVLRLRCPRCDLTYPTSKKREAGLSPDVPCPGDPLRR